MPCFAPFPSSTWLSKWPFKTTDQGATSPEVPHHLLENISRLEDVPQDLWWMWIPLPFLDMAHLSLACGSCHPLCVDPSSSPFFMLFPMPGKPPSPSFFTRQRLLKLYPNLPLRSLDSLTCVMYPFIKVPTALCWDDLQWVLWMCSLREGKVV